MKYVNEYRDGALARDIAAAIAAEVRPDRTYAFLEFCGGSMQTCGVHYAAAAVASSSFAGRKPG